MRDFVRRLAAPCAIGFDALAKLATPYRAPFLIGWVLRGGAVLLMVADGALF